jgi:hypothetical protein
VEEVGVGREDVADLGVAVVEVAEEAFSLLQRGCAHGLGTTAFCYCDMQPEATEDWITGF